MPTTCRSKFLFILPVFLLFTLIARGQVYYKGVIVTTAGDSVAGFVEVNETDFNPSQIKFKKTMDVEYQTLGANDISYFRVDNLYAFRLYTVSISTNPVDLKLLTEDKAYPAVTKPVFLKIIQEGSKLSLFSYKDAVKVRFYAIHDQAPSPYELVYRVIRKDLKFVEAFAFREDLKFVAQRAGVLTQALSNKISTAMYGESYLLKIASTINQIKPKKASQPHVKTYSSGFVVSAGVMTSTILNYKGSNDTGNAFLPNANEATSSNTWVGVGYDIAKNPAAGVVVFRAELNYTRAEYETISYQESFGSRLDMTYRFKQQTVSAGMSMRYHFHNAPKFKVFLSGGLKANYSQYDYTFKIARTVGTTTDYFTNPSAEPRQWFCSLPVQAGLVVAKRYELSVGYSISQALSHDIFLYKFAVSSFQAGLTFHFY